MTDAVAGRGAPRRQLCAHPSLQCARWLLPSLVALALSHLIAPALSAPIGGCQRVVTVNKASQTCWHVRFEHTLSVRAFVRNNPRLDCKGRLAPGTRVCIDPRPRPLRTGSSCNRWMTVSRERQTCWHVRVEQGLDWKDFWANNKGLNCKAPLPVGTRVCIDNEQKGQVLGFCTKWVVVRRRDTCWSIAKDAKVAWPRFKDWNPRTNCSRVQEGQKLCLARLPPGVRPSPARLARPKASPPYPRAGGSVLERPPAPREPRQPAPREPRQPAPREPRQPAPREPRQPAPREPRQPAPRLESPPMRDTGGDSERAALLLHNQCRANHPNTPPLAWSAALEASAQSVADDLGRKCELEHSGLGPENLWASSGLGFEWRDVLAGWYTEELRYFDFRNPGWVPAAGHMTQVVWASANLVGCASRTSSGCPMWKTFVVCRYDNGNVIGQFDTNVFPPR